MTRLKRGWRPIKQYHVLTSDTSDKSEPVYFAELELLAVVPVVRVSNNNNNNNNNSSSTDMDALEKRRSFADMKMVKVTNSSYHGSQVSEPDNLLLLHLHLLSIFLWTIGFHNHGEGPY